MKMLLSVIYFGFKPLVKATIKLVLLVVCPRWICLLRGDILAGGTITGNVMNCLALLAPLVIIFSNYSKA